MCTVVVIGGYGNFGAVISSRLAAVPGIQLIVTGRSATKARHFAASIGASGEKVDSNSPNLAKTLRSLGANVAINCAGPFQNADYRVARAARSWTPTCTNSHDAGSCLHKIMTVCTPPVLPPLPCVANSQAQI